jgi:N-acetylglucosaminyl-diphospho-decaprenol L-rhamnosyltransferase
MKLCVVIVNYRTGPQVLGGLPKLLSELEDLDAGVIVVDNDSGDDSLAAIRVGIDGLGCSNRVEVVSSGHNGGFGAGNNFGIRFAARRGLRPEYVLLLNPDAYPEPGCIRTLLDFMDQRPSAAVAGATLRGVGGEQGPSAFRFPSPLGELESTARTGPVTHVLRRWIIAQPMPAETRECDWVSGACLLLRSSALAEIGLFDERFFLYFEEADLCRRAQALGWSVYWVKDAFVVHAGGVATGIYDCTRRRPRYWFYSRRRYYLKARGRTGLWLANAGWIAGSLLYRLRRLSWQPEGDPPQLLADFVRWTILKPN